MKVQGSQRPERRAVGVVAGFFLIAAIASEARAAPALIKCETENAFQFSMTREPRWSASDPWIIEFDADKGTLAVKAGSVTGLGSYGMRLTAAPHQITFTPQTISFCRLREGCTASTLVYIDCVSGAFSWQYNPGGDQPDPSSLYSKRGRCSPYTEPKAQF